MKKRILRILISHVVFFGLMGMALFGLIKSASFAHLNFLDYTQIESNESIALGSFIALLPIFYLVLLWAYPNVQRRCSYLVDIKM
jgi:hypothetical protein